MFQEHDGFKGFLQAVGGAWGWLFSFGLLSVVAGLCMFFFTGQALDVIAVGFGIWLVVSATYRFVGAFAVSQESGWVRTAYAVVSMAAAVAGAFLIAHPVLSILTLTITIGFFWNITGMLELFAGIEMSGAPGRGWLIVGGLLGIVAGWTLIFSPGISTLALALMLGVWLVVYGISAMVSALRLRSATAPVRAVLRPQHS